VFQYRNPTSKPIVCQQPIYGFSPMAYLSIPVFQYNNPEFLKYDK